MSNTVKVKKEKKKIVPKKQKISNKTLVKALEIIGVIGLDVDIDLDTSSELKLGLSAFEFILKNMSKAQNEIEELLEMLTGIDTSEPVGLIVAIKTVKEDKDVLNFFTDVRIALGLEVSED